MDIIKPIRLIKESLRRAHFILFYYIFGINFRTVSTKKILEKNLAKLFVQIHSGET